MDNKFKVFVIIALVALGTLATTGTFVALAVMNDARGVETSGQEMAIEPKNIAILSLSEPITANLVGDNNSKRIARLAVGFGVDSKGKGYKEVTNKLLEEEMIIRNEIITIVRAQTYEMMSQVDSQEKLAAQIKEKVNELLGTQAIKEVYFGEFFVQ